jgi:hypothetical protein
MRYLTDANESVDSPQLKRSSKVLSWIESEDMLFEDIGTGLRAGEECKMMITTTSLRAKPANKMTLATNRVQ